MFLAKALLSMTIRLASQSLNSPSIRSALSVPDILIIFHLCSLIYFSWFISVFTTIFCRVSSSFTSSSRRGHYNTYIGHEVFVGCYNVKCMLYNKDVCTDVLQYMQGGVAQRCLTLQHKNAHFCVNLYTNSESSMQYSTKCVRTVKLQHFIEIEKSLFINETYVTYYTSIQLFFNVIDIQF